MRCLLLVLLFSCVSFAKADDRLPIPDKAAQQEADELVRTVFDEQIRAATKPDAKSALVKKLLEESAAPDTSPAGRYAMLKAALDVAPDAIVAMSVIDEMAKHFQVDAMRAKAFSLKKISASAVLPPARKPLAEAAAQLADSYIAKDNFSAASALIDIALAAATKSRDAQLIRNVRAKKSDVRSLQKSFAEIEQAMVALKADPADAESNALVGRYKCLVKGDWDADLPMLALGDDEALRKLATKELKGPKASGERVALADSWFDLAQQADGSTKERMLQRAGLWYQFSLRSGPALPRLVKIKVEQRLKKLAPLLEQLAGNNRSSPPPLAVAPFDEATAKKHQWAWAKYLGLPLERRINLPSGVKLTMVLIPPGEFVMGSTAKEQAKFLAEARAAKDKWALGNIPGEAPQHRVRITRAFYLGAYEVTQSQYQQVMGNNPSRFKGANLPVETVSWNDAVEFCRRLSKREGKRYRLPTEAEWEYASRAGSRTAYYFGGDRSQLGQYVWCKSNSTATQPVGRKRPDAWGLYDTYGNVWEWCEDWYDTGYYGASPVDDPPGPEQGSLRVYRGGCWRDSAWVCQSSFRGRSNPSTRYDYLGFRLAAVLVED